MMGNMLHNLVYDIRAERGALLMKHNAFVGYSDTINDTLSIC
jgi:hypothetical protein